MKNKPALFFFCCLFSANALAQAKPFTIDDVIALAKSNSETIKASEKSLQSVNAEIQARDLGLLTPTLTSELALFNDHRETLSATPTSRNNSGLFDLSLTKPFSTGTKFSLDVNHNLLRSDNFTGERNVAAWEAKLTQSLWRNSFGRDTRLRHNSEKAELLARQYQILYDQQLFLANVEGSFWDYSLALKELQLRNQTIERSQSLVKWVKSRIGRFAAESSDLLQVQALESQRQIDLVDAQNRLEIAASNLRGYIPGVDPKSWNVDKNAMEIERNPLQLLAIAGSSTPSRLDALASKYKAKQSSLEAERTSDSLKPQLDAFALYGANGIDPYFSPSWDEAGRRVHSEGQVGLLLTVDLDQGLKSQRRTSAKLAAEADAYRSQALARQSSVGWEEISRNIENLKMQVQEAKALSDLQNKKVTSERRRYEQGRTTVLTITTYEVDAAQSEINYYRLLTNLRKAEAVARTFATEESLIQ